MLWEHAKATSFTGEGPYEMWTRGDPWGQAVLLGVGGPGWDASKLCVNQQLFSSSASKWVLPGPKDQGLQDPWRQCKEHPPPPPQSTYLLVRRQGLVREVHSAGKVARHFGVHCFTFGGLVVIGRFSGEVALFSGGCCVSGQQRQQGGARSSWGIVVLWMCDWNEKARALWAEPQTRLPPQPIRRWRNWQEVRRTIKKSFCF